MVSQPAFDGVPLEDLILRDIDWSLTQEHVEQRDIRKGTHEFAPHVEWATEACSDPLRLMGRTANAVVVIGFSRGAGRVLRVIVRPVGHARDGRWYGLTAHAASARDRHRYEERA